jgi:hypothetical protein
VAVRSLPVITYPIDRDTGTFCIIGRGLLEGRQLYRDLWDNKPPGIFYIYALIVKLLGAVAWCVGLVDLLWLLAISYLIFRFAERYVGSTQAAIAAIVHASWHIGKGNWWAGQPETFVVLFVFISFFLMTGEGRWPKLRYLAAGLLFGTAFWVKYNAVAFFPLLLLIPYLDTSRLDAEPRRLGLLIPWRGWSTRAAVFGAGFAVAVAAVLAYFRLAGLWPSLREVQFVVLPRYATMGYGRLPHYWLLVALHARNLLGPWTEAATAASLAIAWRRRELGRYLPVFFSALLGYGAAAMQVRLHAYFFETAYPFFAIIWGYLAVTVYEGFRALARHSTARGWRLATALFWVLFANLVYWPLPEEIGNGVMDYQDLRLWWRDRDEFYRTYRPRHYLSHIGGVTRVVDYLRANSSLPGGLFVWGTYPMIYFLSQRPCPTRFVSNLALMSPWGPPDWRDELVRDLEKSPPRFVVVARKDWLTSITYTSLDSEQYLRHFPQLNAFIKGHYLLVTDFDDFAVYCEENSASRAEGIPAGEPQPRQARPEP